MGGIIKRKEGGEVKDVEEVKDAKDQRIRGDKETRLHC
jgi:hypothetical protein